MSQTLSINHLLSPQSSSMRGELGLPAARYRQAPKPLQGKHTSPEAICNTHNLTGVCCGFPHLRIHSERLRGGCEQLPPCRYRRSCEKPAFALLHLLHHPIFPQRPPTNPRNPSRSWFLLSPGTKCFTGHLDSKCTLAYGTEMNLWQIQQHGRRAVATERKYQGTGITTPIPCLAARLCSKMGEGEPELPPNTRYPLTFKLSSRLVACLPLRRLRKAAGNRKLKRPQDQVPRLEGRQGPVPSRSTPTGWPAGQRATRDTRWPATFLQALPAPTPSAANSSRKHILR